MYLRTSDPTEGTRDLGRSGERPIGWTGFQDPGAGGTVSDLYGTCNIPERQLLN